MRCIGSSTLSSYISSGQFLPSILIRSVSSHDTKPLECVYINLCSPMPVTSCSGYCYFMNVINDYSSYIWSLPLKAKSDSFSILRGWHCAVKNQSRHKLKVLVTDNGELVSKSMDEWCTQHGIEHQLTTPYTSIQNGRAEHLHCMILNHAQLICITCNAPASLWDEFCATAAYLTNFITSSSLKRRTPHESIP